MILLDTDHLSVFLDTRDPRNESLNSRMQAATEQVACSIVSVEETFRGWLAIIHRLRDVHRQVPAYVRLGRFISVMCEWDIVQFDERAADRCADLRRQRVRIGTMDLKIASVTATAPKCARSLRRRAPLGRDVSGPLHCRRRPALASRIVSTSLSRKPSNAGL